MGSALRPALVATLLATALCGGLYPALVTLVAQVVFARQANGSMIDGGGSELLGQDNRDPRDFWSRPSATTRPYDASSSSGSNLGPSNPALTAAARERVALLRASDPGPHRPLPIDLVTTSASGLDPHISPEAAHFQAPRVAQARGLALDRVDALIASVVENRWLELFGQPRVNVGRLNRLLDRLGP